MRLKLEDSKQALSVQELNEFQEIFHVQLPTAFRQFYLKHNGGDLSDSNDDNDFFLGGFTPIKYGDAPVETIYRDLTDDIPSLKQMIPFAYDRVGNSFLLSVKENDFGYIYIYLMDEEELAFVCESIEEFMSELTNG
jgi:cell wall assembly regulator SMI1